METKHEDHSKEKPPHHQIHHAPSSSSSSSSSSSEFSLSQEFDTQTKDQNPLTSLQEKNDLPESYPSPESQTPKWSMVSASPPPGYMYNFSPENHLSQSPPPLQNYDPNRIPLSVFSSKPANASEWSVASNESLFSIQMGNDYTMDMYKSGELPRLNDCLPTVDEAHEEGSVKSCNNYKRDYEDEDDDDDDDKQGSFSKTKLVGDDNSFGGSNNHEKGKVNSRASSLHHPRVSDPRLSDESGNSNRSFAFPVLVNDAGKNKSLKTVPEKQQLHGHEDVVTTSSPETPNNKASPPSSSSFMSRWCSWFCCWCPRCC